MKRRHVFYLHGFNSSPNSFKARALNVLEFDQRFASYQVPTLPYDPEKVVKILVQTIEQYLPDPIALIGSSLGGFYGTWLMAQYLQADIKAVLLNPAVQPHALLRKYIGENTNFHTGERYTFTQKHTAILRNLDVGVVNPRAILLLAQTHDEIIDHRQMVAHYRGCEQEIIDGGSHGFDHIEHYIDRIAQFFVDPIAG